MNQSHVRNFCIIAHIDHGKSTLADRILELTGTLTAREMENQVLDSMDLERERGITIKSHPVTLSYTARNGETYELNLLDTPGHVDFTYEVSRSLAACEGALLVVDAAQGVEAQTMANYFMAEAQDLHIIPILNKIDLPAADPDRVKYEIEEVLALPADDAVCISAKNGIGIEDVLEAIVHQVPPPSGDPDAPFRALIIDSHYDQYRGVIPLFRVVDGEIKKGTEVRMMTTEKEFKVDEVGVFVPAQKPAKVLKPGSVGYLTAQIREIADTKVGDTITLAGKKQATEPLPGYREVVSMVFCGLYPIDSKDYEDLREALGKLKLNDAALVYEPETSVALGFGFRIGFLGLLHMEIIQERLEREFNLELIATAPSVIYDVYLKEGEEEMVQIQNPYELPPTGDIAYIKEPMVDATIICPEEFVGAVMELCQQRRGEYRDMEYPTDGRCSIRYWIPLGEIITDFFDQLKSRSRGYASLDYEMSSMKESDLVRLDVLVNKEKVDALSTICHREKAFYVGRALTEKLKEVIPRQQFEVPIQAALGTKVIARETVKALRKNVLAKCYGGDISRKRKLLEKQKKGKERLKKVGSVEIPQEAFLAVLKVGSE